LGFRGRYGSPVVAQCLRIGRQSIDRRCGVYGQNVACFFHEARISRAVPRVCGAFRNPLQSFCEFVERFDGLWSVSRLCGTFRKVLQSFRRFVERFESLWSVSTICGTFRGVAQRSVPIRRPSPGRRSANRKVSEQPSGQINRQKSPSVDPSLGRGIPRHFGVKQGESSRAAFFPAGFALEITSPCIGYSPTEIRSGRDPVSK